MLFNKLVGRQIEHIIFNGKISTCNINTQSLLVIQNNHHWRKQRFQFIGNCLERLGCIQLVYSTSSLELLKVSDDILSRLFILFTLTFKFLCLFFSNIVNFVFPAESFLYGLVRGSKTN